MRIEVALALVLLAGPALADDLDCSEKALSTGVQMTLNACAVRDAQRSDEALDATYGKLAGKLDTGARAALKTAELAWISFRDATCELRNVGLCRRQHATDGDRRLSRQGKAKPAKLC